MLKTRHFITTLILLFCISAADAQISTERKSLNSSGRNIKSGLFLKHKKPVAEINLQTLGKKATVKKIASITYISLSKNTGAFTDTSAKYTITWGPNGTIQQIEESGWSNEIIEGQILPYRYIYSDFITAHPLTGGDVAWLLEGEDDYIARNITAQYKLNNTWVNGFKANLTVSNEGLTQEYVEQIWQNNNWSYIYRETFTYNPAGQQTSRIQYDWNGSGWENSLREFMIYDVNNRYQGFEIQNWDEEWMTTEGQRTNYTYNEKGNVVAAEEQIYDTASANWAPYRFQSFVVDTAGVITQATEQYFVNGGWVNHILYDSIIWQSFDTYGELNYPLLIGGSNYLYMQQSMWNGTDWNVTQRMIKEYLGNMLTNDAKLNWNGTTWDSTFKTIYTYYANGDERETMAWSKQPGGNWLPTYGSAYENTYDNDGDMLTSIFKVWDEDANRLVNEDMTIYTYTEAASIREKNTMLSTLKIFPNPASNGKITINLKQISASPLTITVYDLSGKVVIHSKFELPEANITLDVVTLPKGMYNVTLIQGSAFFRNNLIIQ